MVFSVVAASLAVYKAVRDRSADSQQQLTITRGDWNMTYRGSQFHASDWDRFAAMLERVVAAVEGQQTEASNKALPSDSVKAADDLLGAPKD